MLQANTLAGKTVTIRQTAVHPQYPDFGGAEIQVEDTWEKVNGTPWQRARGNPACTVYGSRVHQNKLPADDQIVYGKLNGLGVIVHVSEITHVDGESVEDNPGFSDDTGFDPANPLEALLSALVGAQPQLPQIDEDRLRGASFTFADEENPSGAVECHGKSPREYWDHLIGKVIETESAGDYVSMVYADGFATAAEGYIGDRDVSELDGEELVSFIRRYLDEEGSVDPLSPILMSAGLALLSSLWIHGEPLLAAIRADSARLRADHETQESSASSDEESPSA